MDNKINLSQLADLLAQAGGMSKTASEQFVKNFFDIISQKVIDEGLVKVKGLGTFKLIDMEDRESVNVNSGERFTIEGHQKISFIPDAELKERINKPFAAFETVEINESQAAEINKMDQEQSDKNKDNILTNKTTNVMEKGKQNEPKKELKETKDENQNRCTKIILWVLAGIAVLALIIVLLWPVIGGKALKKADKDVKEKAPAPAVVKPEPKPAAAPAAPKKEEAKFTLTKADQEKALPLFTAADTVNYKIVGTMTTHTMVKGDMLTTIALKYYGTKKLWPYIAKYNGLKPRQFKKMPVGYKVKVPKLANK